MFRYRIDQHSSTGRSHMYRYPATQTKRGNPLTIRDETKLKSQSVSHNKSF